jgi:D-glycero-alpha-D-manno-heptose-7-phosphate kinase
VAGEADDGQPADVTSKLAEQHSSAHYNARVRIDSSAPTRIDLAGGTFDIWPLYLFHDRAQTINAAISLRAHCTLTSRQDSRVTLVSEDTGERVEAAGPESLAIDGLPLVARLVRHFGARGVDVHTRSESPVGAGIAGSSAMNVAVAAALAAWTGVSLDPDQLLSVAMNVEAQVIGVPTGVQDYRPAFYGGVSAVEMDVAGVRRVALDVDLTELGRRIVLAYTGASRSSGINNWDVMVRRIRGDADVASAFDAIRDAAAAIRTALERGDWADAARQLSAEWTARKRLAPGVTTPAIDELFGRARDAGALAGKVCGAGGGGCLFCLVEPDRHAAVADALTAGGATVLACAFEERGLTMARS